MCDCVCVCVSIGIFKRAHIYFDINGIFNAVKSADWNLLQCVKEKTRRIYNGRFIDRRLNKKKGMCIYWRQPLFARNNLLSDLPKRLPHFVIWPKGKRMKPILKYLICCSLLSLLKMRTKILERNQNRYHSREI